MLSTIFRSAEADEPLVIVGHSFDSNEVCYLENRHPEKIKNVVFISACLSLKNTDCMSLKQSELSLRECFLI